MALSKQNVESELSYAYLHAVAGKAGMSCKIGDRHDDSAGVDVEVIYRGMTPHTYRRQVQLNIQIKATIKSPGNYPDHMVYFVQGKERYEKLRTNDSANYKIIVVLFLPKDPTSWLTCSANDLILKNAAYWTCLYGATKCSNDSGETIYLPKKNLLTPTSLNDLVMQAVMDTIPTYTQP